MRVLYEELRQLTEHSEPADKNVVLLDAIKLIQNLRNETEQLERQVFEKRKKARTGMAPPSTTSTTSPMTPTSLAQQAHSPSCPTFWSSRSRGARAEGLRGFMPHPLAQQAVLGAGAAGAERLGG
eukprot:CAMPEP_0184329424 /NCGR_PEP_ID=MMETSP1049-20130417/144144_1 /TAXON_ID=77928 /ORGANISM="Proteomonas sulcata, Strain CCMP704" /LENGTH=124 /DNA_ID=CAMNT_0026651793 /DNA_START=771 /DNA_END=1146 /DNA_ORIENTATION=-